MGDITTQTRTLAPGPDGPHPDDEKRTFLGLSLSQIAGSALAAVTAAVAASFLGVAGTLIGAAFGSVVSTVAGAAYASSLKTAATRVRTTRTVVVRPGPDGVRGASQSDPARVPSGFGASPVALGRVEALRSDPDGGTTYRAAGGDVGGRGLLARVPWKPVAAVAALGFVLGLGLLTVTEGVLGRPVSGSASGGTTLGEVVGGSSGGIAPEAPAPSGPATDPAATGTPSQPAPSDAPSASDPVTGTATDPAGGAEPTPTDGATTATDAPAATPTADPSGTDPAAGASRTP